MYIVISLQAKLENINFVALKHCFMLLFQNLFVYFLCVNLGIFLRDPSHWGKTLKFDILKSYKKRIAL